MTTAELPSLADAVVDGLGRLTLRLWPQRSARPGTELLDAARRVAGELARRDLTGRPVGAVLDTSWPGLSFLVGAVLAGVRLCSLPDVPRATGADQHARLLARVARQLDLAAVVTARPAPGTPGGLTFDELDRCGGPPPPPVDGFQLVQFSSGSTGDPKGIVLPRHAIVANAAAVIPSMCEPDFVGVSWLPLSHDMGLVGATFTPIIAAGGGWCGSGTLALIPPSAFVRRPQVWLETCSELGATFTAAPDFGYRLVTPLVGRGLDLSRLRGAAIGAEPVRPRTLHGFERAAAGTGLAPTALRPCYGLAEATLAVTMTSPDEPWRAVRLDREELDAGRAVEVEVGDGREDRSWVELTGVGPPLPGFEVRIADGLDRRGGVGPIEIRGPSLLERYTDGSVPVDADGWFTTNDLGVMVEGQLHVVGRGDDVLVVAGRVLHPHDVEDAAAGPGLRPGAVMAVRGAGGHPVVLFEPARDAPLDPIARERQRRSIARRVLDATGVAPAAVLACRPGALPRTPSGKPRRRVAARWLDEGTLPLLDDGSPLDDGREAPDDQARGVGTEVTAPVDPLAPPAGF